MLKSINLETALHQDTKSKQSGSPEWLKMGAALTGPEGASQLHLTDSLVPAKARRILENNLPQTQSRSSLRHRERLVFLVVKHTSGLPSEPLSSLQFSDCASITTVRLQNPCDHTKLELYPQNSNSRPTPPPPAFSSPWCPPFPDAGFLLAQINLSSG